MTTITPELVYETALDPEVGPANLASLMAEAFGGRTAIVHWISNDGAQHTISQAGLAPELIKGFEAHAHLDPWTRAAMRVTPNRVHRMTKHVPEAAYRGSAFFNEFVRPMGDDTGWCMGAVFSVPGGRGAVALHRGWSQGDFTEDQQARLSAVAPHLGRVLDVRWRLLNAERRAALAEESLQPCSSGIMHVRSDGRLLFANAAAQAMLARADGVALRRGAVRAVHPGASGLAETFAFVVAQGGPVTLSIPKSGGGTPYGATIGRLRSSAPPVALMLLSDPDQTPPDRSELLRAVWRLTPAEAELVCLLLEGCSPEEAAEHKGVRISTVRAQLRGALEKTGASRQSELVAKAARLTPARP